MSIPHAAAVSFPREEALLIASLLALDRWISRCLHLDRSSGLCQCADRQSSCLRKFAPHKAPQISVVTEIVFLFVIAILHNRLPGVAGTLGLSFVAAFQTASFPKVEQPSPEARRRGRFAGPMCLARCASLSGQEPPSARS